jgi:drug/metabolite transporter (DMT)-like permease
LSRPERSSHAGTSVHLTLLVAQLCFASLSIAGRLAMQGAIGPAGIVMARMVGGAAVLATFAWWRGVLRIDKRDVPAIVGCSVLGMAANQELFVQGLARSTAVNASLLGSTAPVFTAIVAIMLGRERVQVRRLAGIAIAFAAAAVLVGVDRVSTAEGHRLGTMLLVLCALSYGTFLVVVRPLAEQYDPLGLLAWMFVFAAPMVVPFGIIELASTPPLGAGDIGYLAFLIAVPTVAAYGLVQVALKRSESSLVAAYVYLQPVLAAIGAWFLLDEELTVRTVVCGVIVLGGVWLASRKGR